MCWVLNKLLIRYILNGRSFTAMTWLKFYYLGDSVAPFIVTMLSQHGHSIAMKKVLVLIKYCKNLVVRPPVMIDTGAIQGLLSQATTSEMPDGHAAKLTHLLEAIMTQSPDASVGEALPLVTSVIPAGTITGRDTTKGGSLAAVPKAYWHQLLSPPIRSSYVLLDYSSQEPVITAVKAQDKNILALYEQGDLYDALNSQVTNGELSRDRFKDYYIRQFYGQSPERVSEQLGISTVDAVRWSKKLKAITKLLNKFLDKQACNARSVGEIQSLDWRMAVNSETNYLSLRNWPIQACGADILHRGCLALSASGIPVLLTNHDSFLIQVNNQTAQEEISLAVQLLRDASADVLDGYKLKVKVELRVKTKLGENDE